MPSETSSSFGNLLLAGILAFALSGCREEKARTGRDRPAPPVIPAVAEAPPDSTRKKPPIMGTDSVSGLTALQDTVRARAMRGDTVGLVRLMTGDSAYRRHIYPHSPAYDRNREEVFQFVLTMHKANNAKGLRRLLGAMQTDSGRTAFRPAGVDSLPTPGGMIYRTLASDSLRLFSEALRQGDWIRVVSYSGARSRPPVRDPMDPEAIRDESGSQQD